MGDFEVKLAEDSPQGPQAACTDGICAIEPVGTWELINPQGAIRAEPLRLSVRPETLEGKTVLLRWNGKQNGDIFLNRLAELLQETGREIGVVKAWEAFPESVEAISGSQERSAALAKGLVALKPDIVVGSHGD